MKKPTPVTTVLEALALTLNEDRCFECGNRVVAGEPWGVADYTGYTLCSGCASDYLFVNGPVDLLTACVALRRQLTTLSNERWAVVHQREGLDEAIGLLELLAGTDIAPYEVKRALALLQALWAVYPSEIK